MNWTHDIVVAGGGPAGCAFALAMRRLHPDLRILVIERSDYSKPRVGETLPPQCRTLLEKLGIWEDFLNEKQLPAYGALSAWGSEALVRQEFMTTVQRNGWHLDRNRFDSFMARQAMANGAEVWQHTSIFSVIQLPAGGWTVATDGKEGHVSCRLLVDATGRKASVARMAGTSLVRFDRLMGIMALIDAGAHTDRDTLVEAAPQGWWYSALLPGNKIAAAFFTDADIARKQELSQVKNWLKCLSKAPVSAGRLYELAQQQALNLKSWPTQSQRLLEAAGPGWLAVGDAALAFDPLSSQGIYFAMHNALVAVQAAQHLLEGGRSASLAAQQYTRYLLEQFTGYWEVRRDFYNLEQRWADQFFWKNRHAPINLGPEDWVVILPVVNKKPLFFQPADINALVKQYPDGASAGQWMRLLLNIRPDLPSGHALEGLQSLIADGFAVKNSTNMQAL